MNFRIPKFDMALALLAVCILAIIGKFSFGLMFRFLEVTTFTLLIEFIFWKIRKVPNFFPSAGFVTAFIVFLISDPSAPIYLVLLAPLISVLLKQFVRPWGNHIFNPAASGLFVSSFFGNILSWWGPNVSTLTFWAVILFCGYVSQIYVRHWKITIPFWVAVFLLTYVLTRDISLGLTQFKVGSTLFFALVMLPEPMTAPNLDINKYIYGAVIGIFTFITVLTPIAQDPSIAALLLGNLGFEVWENKESLAVKRQQQP